MIYQPLMLLSLYSFWCRLNANCPSALVANSTYASLVNLSRESLDDAKRMSIILSPTKKFSNYNNNNNKTPNNYTLVLRGWRLSSNTWNPITSAWTKQLTWLRIVHSGDWWLCLELCTPSAACQKRRRRNNYATNTFQNTINSAL